MLLESLWYWQFYASSVAELKEMVLLKLICVVANCREFEQRMGDIVPSCLTAGEQAVNNVFLTSEALEVLMQQVGTSHDTYACRAKLHSLRDAMNTLIRHTQ